MRTWPPLRAPQLRPACMPSSAGTCGGEVTHQRAAVRRSKRLATYSRSFSLHSFMQPSSRHSVTRRSSTHSKPDSRATRSCGCKDTAAASRTAATAIGLALRRARTTRSRMSKWCALVYVMSGIPSGTARSQPGDTRSDAAFAASPSAECVAAAPAAARRRALPPARLREAASASLAFQGSVTGASGGHAAQSGAKAAHRPAAAAAPGSFARGSTRQAHARAAMRRAQSVGSASAQTLETHRAAWQAVGLGGRAGEQRAAGAASTGVLTAHACCGRCGGAEGERKRSTSFCAACAARRERGEHGQRRAHAPWAAPLRHERWRAARGARGDVARGDGCHHTERRKQVRQHQDMSVRRSFKHNSTLSISNFRVIMVVGSSAWGASVALPCLSFTRRTCASGSE